MKLRAALMLVAGLALALGLGWFALGRQASAAVLPPEMAGCALPPATASGHTFYVDPVAGSASGDGSAAKPWQDLSQVLRQGLVSRHQRTMGKDDNTVVSNPAAVVGDGDTILLRSGDYGKVVLTRLVNTDNFITIAAAPGATPLLESLKVTSASRFVIRGLTLRRPLDQDRKQADVPLLLVAGPETAPSSNIWLEDLDIGSASAAASVDPASFAQQGPKGVVLSGECLTLSASRIHDVRVAIGALKVRKAQVANNRVHDFTIDGLDFSGSLLRIQGNVITDHLPVGDSHHPDCMQGQPQAMGSALGDVTITHNTCIVRTGVAPTIANAMQGISIFDGDWTNVTVRCNLVIPLAWHGITLMGVDRGLIENNVVLSDNAAVAGTQPGETPWINIGAHSRVTATKSQRMPTASVIRGNIASAFTNDPEGNFEKVKSLTGVTFGPGNRRAVLAEAHGARNGNPSLALANLPGPLFPLTLEQAQARYPLPADCSR